MIADLNKVRIQIESNIVVGDDFERNPHGWLKRQSDLNGFRYLLAYAQDGVIWGQFLQDGLVLAGDEFSSIQVVLAPRNLIQLRAFGERAELLMWQDYTCNQHAENFETRREWHARILRDGKGDEVESFDENYLLWGWKGEKGKQGNHFTLLVEGEQGLMHAPPVIGLGAKERAVLVVRHYLGQNEEEDQAFIALSRLVRTKREKEF
jgi:CRISPR-associated protein (TIGR03984 family)